jgi:hypothetical protein
MVGLLVLDFLDNWVPNPFLFGFISLNTNFHPLCGNHDIVALTCCVSWTTYNSIWYPLAGGAFSIVQALEAYYISFAVETV